MEEIRFSSLDPFVLRDLRQEKPGPKELMTRAEYYRPEAAAPLPAVVVVEGLGGLKKSRETLYGRWLASHGIAALVVDTFGSRGAARYPHPVRAITVTESMFLADTFGALRWLAGRDEIDASRIGVMGFSYGGMIVGLSAYEQMRRRFLGESELRFAGHVSYYGCSVPRMEDARTTGAPVMFLLGELDRNVSIERAERIAEDMRTGGSPVDFQLLEGVYHQWDSDDRKRRFVPFNLRACKVRIDPQDELHDENTGVRIRGFATRTYMLARSVGIEGYHIQRDDEAHERTNELLLGFLRRSGERSPALAGAA